MFCYRSRIMGDDLRLFDETFFPVEAIFYLVSWDWRLINLSVSYYSFWAYFYISVDLKPESGLNLATYENFDHFSMDEALDFVQNLSGQTDDVDIWTNVVKEQHVKYLNGTFFFTPRENSPVNNSQSDDSSSP